MSTKYEVGWPFDGVCIFKLKTNGAYDLRAHDLRAHDLKAQDLRALVLKAHIRLPAEELIKSK